ncbi:TRAF3-interacting protein 1 N-terminal domain-containing protein [Plasmodiophora brassicae]
MASSSALDALTEQTAAMVSSLISKPKMTTKLLSKPPFRFLHDTVTAVLQATGFPRGLFDDAQLDSANIADKDGKIRFLQTLVDCCSQISGTPLAASPSKIVSGLEPENTNVFLQTFAKIAAEVKDGRADNDALIARFKSGASGPPVNLDPSPSPPPATAAPAPAAAAAAAPAEAVPPPRPEAQPSSSMPAVEPPESAPTLSREVTPDSDAGGGGGGGGGDSASFVEATRVKLGAIITKPALKPELLARPPFRFIHDIVRELNNATGGRLDDVFTKEQLSARIDGAPARAAFLKKLVEFTAANGGRNKTVNVKKVLSGLDAAKTNEILQDLADIVSRPRRRSLESSSTASRPGAVPAPARPPRAAREPVQQEAPPAVATTAADPTPAVPEIARPAPPRVETNVVEHVQGPEEHHDAAGQARGVILEGGGGASADDEEEAEDDHNEDVRERMGVVGEIDASNAGKHGKLVRDILKEQEKVASNRQEGGASAVDKAAGIKLGRIGGTSKDRRGSYSQQQIDIVREQIQKLCQSVNPLGKCIDFVFEDLDLMKRELERWKQEQEVQQQRLQAEQRATGEQLQPLRDELDRVNREIGERRDQIRALRGSILRNDDQLKQMLERQVQRSR